MNGSTINPSPHAYPAESISLASLRAPEELRQPFEKLAEALLHAARGREVIFLQNDGNYGDSLIRYGTVRFFEDIGLKYREYDMVKRSRRYLAFGEGLLDRLRRRHLFVFSGSGGWADACQVGQGLVHRQFAASKNLFILPTTFQYFGLPPDIPVFARDQFESLEAVPQAKFCHDMAFYLALVTPERLLAKRVATTQRLGLLFRTDNEARKHRLATLPGNVDISTSGTHNSDPVEFLRFIDQFSVIATDRLHVTIGAILLGKRVLLTEGNYFKIRAIYDSSIRGIFDNCELVQDDEMYARVNAYRGDRERANPAFLV
jgi:exopolysaccharide biosynthesis predicted pyruvyltransferase EpsI